MYFEIINSDTGEVVPDGEYGEVVFTTLTRKAMPLIRYRTGDYSRFIDRPCDCGTRLKTLEKISARIKNNIFLNQGLLTINMLDDLLFNYDRLLDYKAILTKEKDYHRLTIIGLFLDHCSYQDIDQLHKIILGDQRIKKLINESHLIIEITFAEQETFNITGAGKREIKIV